MPEQLAATATFAAPCVPLIGVVVLWVSRSLQIRSAPRGVALWSACLSLAFALVSLGGRSVSWELGNWLSVPGTGFQIPIAFHGDELARAWLVVASAASVGAVLSLAPTRFDDAGAVQWLLAASACAQLCVVSGSFLQFIVCSQLAVVFVGHALGWRSGRSLVRAGAFGDLLIVICLMSLWSVGIEPSFATLSRLDALFATVESDAELSMMRAVTGFAATCLVGAFLVKCAQFPFGHWLIAGSESSREFAAGALLTVLPPGVFLLFRGLPLLAGAPAALSLLGGVACLSALLVGMMALTAQGLPQSVAMLASGACSLAAIAIAQAGSSGALAGAYIAAGSLILGTALLSLTVDSVQEPRWTAVAVLAGCLTCGVWGQDAVLRLLWHVDQSKVSAGPVVGVPLFPILVLLAHGMFSAGLFRTLRPPRGGVSPIVLAAVGLAAVLPVVVIARTGHLDLSGLSAMLRPGMCGLATLIALVGVYLTRQSSKRDAAGGQRSGLMEMSRRRLYLGEFGKYGWAIPMRAASRAAAFVESLWSSEVSRGSGALGLFESVGRDEEQAGEPVRSTALLALILATVTALTLLIAD